MSRFSLLGAWKTIELISPSMISSAALTFSPSNNPAAFYFSSSVSSTIFYGLFAPLIGDNVGDRVLLIAGVFPR